MKKEPFIKFPNKITNMRFEYRICLYSKAYIQVSICVYDGLHIIGYEPTVEEGESLLLMIEAL